MYNIIELPYRNYIRASIIFKNDLTTCFTLVSAFPRIPNDATGVHRCFYGAGDEEHLDIGH